jgi:hypothetical protein
VPDDDAAAGVAQVRFEQVGAGRERLRDAAAAVAVGVGDAQDVRLDRDTSRARR